MFCNIPHAKPQYSPKTFTQSHLPDNHVPISLYIKEIEYSSILNKPFSLPVCVSVLACEESGRKARIT